MFNLTEEMADTELSMAHLKVGAVGWPYFEQRVQQRFQEGWRGGGVREGEDEAELWLLPRHFPICSFGIFNPVGPTVSSLELSYVVPKEGDATWYLYLVLRHPFSPQITYLGAAPTREDIDRLIIEALSETDPATGVFGSSPDWLDIFSHKEAVVEGARNSLCAHPKPTGASKPRPCWSTEVPRGLASPRVSREMSSTGLRKSALSRAGCTPSPTQMSLLGTSCFFVRRGREQRHSCDRQRVRKLRRQLWPPESKPAARGRPRIMSSESARVPG